MEHRVLTVPPRLVARPWLLAFVPINAASAGFGVTLPLLILVTLHSSWSVVALAATLFNSAVIGASLFWGYVADRFPTRRNLLLVNFAGFAVLFFALAEVHTTFVLLALYTVIGVLAPAGANAGNLLILEKFRSEERPAAFASFQEMTILGSIAGLLIGYGWLAVALPLAPLLYVLAALATASVVAVLVGVHDAPRTVSLATVAHHPESLLARLRHSSALHLSFPFFPKLPVFRRGAWTSFRRWVREEARHELPLVLAATLLFNFSSNLFNISYTPYLYSVGIGAASIFLVNFANNFAQSVTFPLSGTLSSRVGPDRLVQRSTYVRSLGYLLVVGLTIVPLSASVAFGFNVVAFGILGGAIAFYSTASTLLLFHALEGRDAGRLIGLSSALGGFAAVGGAAVSGVLSVFGSFRLVFLVSALTLLASVPIWSAAEVAAQRRRRLERVPPETSERDDAPRHSAKPD
ncbi:MAG: MFS transporter [Thermoplasmata archaeon]|nr:MFS transporter [Thermoplasmata archaeon]